MKLIEKNVLVRISKFYFISILQKEVKESIIEYWKESHAGVNAFNRKLISKGLTRESEQFKTLSKLYKTALLFRSTKKLYKSLAEMIFATQSFLIFFAIPIIVPAVFFEMQFSFWNHVLILIAALVAAVIGGFLLERILQYLNNYEIKLGKPLTRLIQITFVLSLFSPAYYLFELNENFLKALSVSVYSIALAIVARTTFEQTLKILIDAYFYSKKLNITEALIIESAFRLSDFDWKKALIQREKRQVAIIEIERFSALIEKDWSNQIIPGDPKTSKWKSDTFRGIAQSVRKNKRSVIIPDKYTDISLHYKFDRIFEKLIEHDLKALIDSEVPAIRVQKKKPIVWIKNALIAILPISISLVVKDFLPTSFNENYIHIGVAISTLWLLLNLLLWLDPNISDKIAAAKSLRSYFKDD